MSVARFLIKRTVVTFFLLIAIITALFFFFRSMPGSYLDILIQQGASPETVENIREQWGLNDPLYVQYFRFMVNMAGGDAGTSFQYNQPVWEVVRPRMINSFLLVAPGITLAYILGSLYGTVLGTNRGSFSEKYGIIPPTIVGTIPSFFIAILLIIVFSSWFGIFPSSGMLSIDLRRTIGVGGGGTTSASNLLSYGDFWMHYFLPFSAVVLRYLYIPTLIMRTSVVEVVGQDFINYHRLTGIAKFKRFKQTIKHASLPVLTIFPVSMTRAIGGMVLIEVVFNWPGIGQLLVDAVLFRDFPIVQFVFFLVAIWIVVANFAVDVVYGIIDPRVSIGGSD